MKKTVIACRTLERELTKAMDGQKWDVRWLESGLHNTPKVLTKRLQETLDSCEGSDLVLLAMGFCGNAVVGLRSGNFSLILPRVDDCISLVLGGSGIRLSYPATYFLTRGWLDGERNLWREYVYTIQRYGESLGNQIFQTMLHSYQTLALIDTGCFDLPAAEMETRQIAEKLNLTYQSIPGTLSYLRQLLNGPWPEEQFIQLSPHSILTGAQCIL